MNCVRCWTTTPATETVRFCYRDDTYELTLCASHADQLGTDLSAWMTVAVPLPSHQPLRRSYEPGATMRRHAKVEIPRWGPLEDQIDTATDVPARRTLASVADNWQWTRHAHERAKERNVSVDEILRTLVAPQWTRPSPTNPGSVDYFREGVRVVVAPENRVILTVMRQGEGPDEQLQEERISA